MAFPSFYLFTCYESECPFKATKFGPSSYIPGTYNPSPKG